jgi:hypothetical protein
VHEDRTGGRIDIDAADGFPVDSFEISPRYCCSSRAKSVYNQRGKPQGETILILLLAQCLVVVLYAGDCSIVDG